MSLEIAISEARKTLGLDPIPARLGDGNGNVYDLDLPGNYFLRKLEADGKLSKPFSLPAYPNANLPTYDGLPVLIGYDEFGVQCIKRADHTAAQTAGVNSYIFNPQDQVVNSQLSQANIVTLKCTRHGNTVNFPTTVVVLKGPIKINGVMYLFPGGAIDIASLIPTTGLWCYVVIFVRTDMTLEAFASTPQALTDPLTMDDVNECIVQATTGSIIDWGWKVGDGQTALTGDADKNVDLRQLINVVDSTSSGTSEDFTPLILTGWP